jgi:hypothetical protein
VGDPLWLLSELQVCYGIDIEPSDDRFAREQVRERRLERFEVFSLGVGTERRFVPGLFKTVQQMCAPGAREGIAHQTTAYRCVPGRGFDKRGSG